MSESPVFSSVLDSHTGLHGKQRDHDAVHEIAGGGATGPESKEMTKSNLYATTYPQA
jgi:hypothetical protein